MGTPWPGRHWLLERNGYRTPIMVHVRLTSQAHMHHGRPVHRSVR
jgi:hypothetical protein